MLDCKGRGGSLTSVWSSASRSDDCCRDSTGVAGFRTDFSGVRRFLMIEEEVGLVEGVGGLFKIGVALRVAREPIYGVPRVKRCDLCGAGVLATLELIDI